MKSGVSCATLSRLERPGSNPTTELLDKICSAYGMSVSRLMMMAEDTYAAFIGYGNQPEFEDPETGFARRSVSPPSTSLAGEIAECHLPPETAVSYEPPSSPGTEHHLVLLDGELTVSIDDKQHRLTGGDCLRYQLYGTTRFATSKSRGARYMLVIIGGRL